jgi:hypothetical protein
MIMFSYVAIMEDNYMWLDEWRPDGSDGLKNTRIIGRTQWFILDQAN